MELFLTISLTAMIVMGPVNAGIVAGNTWLSRQKSRNFSGPIVDKWISYNRGKSYNVRFIPSEISRDVWLSVSEGEYSNLKIGNKYQRQMTLGAYGILYFEH